MNYFKKIVVAALLIVMSGVVSINVVQAETASCVQLTVTLNRGSNNTEQVKLLQQYLTSKGYPNLTENGQPIGIFGKTTEDAIKDFQKVNNLEVSGIVGPLTRGVIAKDTGCETTTIADVREGARDLKITHPNEGATWKQGGQARIGYTSKNLKDAAIHFSIVSTATPVQTFVLESLYNKDERGTVTIDVPRQAASGTYYVQVSTRLLNGIQVADKSDQTINIVGKDKAVRDDLPTISITAPDADDVWEKGESHKVEWDKEGGKNLTFAVILYNVTTGQRTVVKDNVPNTGKTTISAAQLAPFRPGIYEVRLFDMASTSGRIIRDVSEQFEIVAKNDQKSDGDGEIEADAKIENIRVMHNGKATTTLNAKRTISGAERKYIVRWDGNKIEGKVRAYLKSKLTGAISDLGTNTGSEKQIKFSSRKLRDLGINASVDPSIPYPYELVVTTLASSSVKASLDVGVVSVQWARLNQDNDDDDEEDEDETDDNDDTDDEVTLDGFDLMLNDAACIRGTSSTVRGCAFSYAAPVNLQGKLLRLVFQKADGSGTAKIIATRTRDAANVKGATVNIGALRSEVAAVTVGEYKARLLIRKADGSTIKSDWSDPFQVKNPQ